MDTYFIDQLRGQTYFWNQGEWPDLFVEPRSVGTPFLEPSLAAKPVLKPISVGRPVSTSKLSSETSPGANLSCLEDLFLEPS